MSGCVRMKIMKKRYKNEAELQGDIGRWFKLGLGWEFMRREFGVDAGAVEVKLGARSVAFSKIPDHQMISLCRAEGVEWTCAGLNNAGVGLSGAGSLSGAGVGLKKVKG